MPDRPRALRDASEALREMSHQIIDPIADLRREPAHEAALDTQALFGERVTDFPAPT